MQFTHLSDEEVVSQLTSLCLAGRRLVASVIVHLIEVEDRGIHVKAACDSMWAFCTRRCGMSHGETSRRLNAAKLVRRFPSLLGRIERGEIHLSSLKILGSHLTESNVEALLDEAKGKSKMEVQELVARQARGSKPGHIPQATRREVFERDGEQCTYVDTEGRRCDSRTRLELDHIQPRGQGGGDEASNLRVTCRPHNKLYAEEAYGKEFVAEKIHCRQRQSQRVMNAELVRESAAVQVELTAPALSPATVTTSTPVETIELASRGLVNMGFAKADVRRAVDAICARRAGQAMAVQALLREAIAVLT